MEDMKFQVMYYDNVAADVTIINNRAKIVKYDDCPIHHLFPWEEADAFSVMEILEGRCWPRDRANIDGILDKLGLPCYDVLGIIHKTHGRKYDDYVWIRFDGEDLKYEDIQIRDKE